jgi:hypothetical protein
MIDDQALTQIKAAVNTRLANPNEPVRVADFMPVRIGLFSVCP